MIALMLASAQVGATPARSASPDIIVVGSRMKKIRLSAQTDRKGRVTQCQVTVSSGDSAFDAQACLATRDCAAKGVKAGDAMTECVDRRLITFVEAERDRPVSRNESHAPN